jgi:apolipoprotein N-acyltransferase
MTPAATVPLAHHNVLARFRDWAVAGTDARRAALTFLSGIFSAAAFAPIDFWPLMIAAFALLVWQIDATPTVKRAAIIGWYFAFGQFLAGLYWIAISFQYQGDMPAFFGWIAVLLLAAALAIFGALAGALARKFWSAAPTRIFVLAAMWALVEAMRGTILTGFPWNSVGMAWLPVAPVAQFAALFGIFGLSIVIVLTGGTLALFAEAPKHSNWRQGLLAGLGLIFLGGVVYILLTPVSYDTTPQVHIVQANIGQEDKWRDDGTRFQLRQHLELTRAVIAERGSGLVIWPETAVPNLIDEELSTRYLISRALGDKSKLITGADRLVRSVDGTPVAAMNSLMILDSDGSVLDIYDKVHLVPFGEYMPWRATMAKLGLNRLVAGRLDFAPGARLRTLSAAGVPAFSPLICYEAGFPGDVVGWGPRPAWLVNLSNDAWFGASSGPFQHLAQARVRSIEEGLPMVRSTPTGVSAVIDPHGRVRAKTPFGVPTVLTAQVPQALAPTPFARLGNLLFLVLAGVCLAVGLVRTRGS